MDGKGQPSPVDDLTAEIDEALERIGRAFRRLLADSLKQQPRTLTKREASEQLGCSARMIGYMMDDGRLPVVRIGSNRKTTQKGIDDYLARGEPRRRRRKAKRAAA